jgi:hypothetical protein
MSVNHLEWTNPWVNAFQASHKLWPATICTVLKFTVPKALYYLLFLFVVSWSGISGGIPDIVMDHVRFLSKQVLHSIFPFIRLIHFTICEDPLYWRYVTCLSDSSHHYNWPLRIFCLIIGKYSIVNKNSLYEMHICRAFYELRYGTFCAHTFSWLSVII